MRIAIKLPPISEEPLSVTVVRVQALEREFILKGRTVVEIETTKAVFPIISHCSGVVTRVAVKVGDVLRAGDLLVEVEAQHAFVGTEDAQRRRASVAVGLRYLATRHAFKVCHSERGVGQNFDDLQPFVERVIALARSIESTDFDVSEDVVVIDLRDTLYQVTYDIARLESFEWAALKLQEAIFLLRSVADTQDVMIRRLLRAEAACAGRQIDPRWEDVQTAGVFNPGRAYVFVSHDHTDMDDAKVLARALEEGGVARFLDAGGITPGSAIPAVIHTALRRASHIVVMITPGSVQSQWVAYETGFASGAGKKIIPYVLDPRIKVPGFMQQLAHLGSVADAEEFIGSVKTFKRVPELRAIG